MHPLYGPRARIERSNSQIVTLAQGFERFFRENPYEISVAEYNPKAKNYSLRVKGGPQEFPVDWSLLIGEITHNLRAALDGLAWQLALQTTITPYERTAFPIYLLGRTVKRTKGHPLPHFWGKAHGLRRIQSIPRPLWARIESFQPYKRGNRGRRSPLFCLEDLNNTDKHRLLTVLVATPATLQFSGLSGGTHFKTGMTLSANAKIGWVRDVPPNEPGPGRGGIYMLDLATGELLEPEMQVNVKAAPGVLFGDTCRAVKRLPVILTLRRIADQVSSIVESFAGEF